MYYNFLNVLKILNTCENESSTLTDMSVFNVSVAIKSGKETESKVEVCVSKYLLILEFKTSVNSIIKTFNKNTFLLRCPENSPAENSPEENSPVENSPVSFSQIIFVEKMFLFLKNLIFFLRGRLAQASTIDCIYLLIKQIIYPAHSTLIKCI